MISIRFNRTDGRMGRLRTTGAAIKLDVLNTGTSVSLVRAPLAAVLYLPSFLFNPPRDSGDTWNDDHWL